MIHKKHIHIQVLYSIYGVNEAGLTQLLTKALHKSSKYEIVNILQKHGKAKS